MANNPMQLWEESAFLAECYSGRFNRTQENYYRNLLQKAFYIKTAPRLPNEDSQLMELANEDDRSRWEENKAKVLDKFYKKTVKGVQLLAHDRLERDWKRAVESKRIYSDKGKKSGLVRKYGKISKLQTNTGSTQVQPTFNTGSTQVEHSGEEKRREESSGEEREGSMKSRAKIEEICAANSLGRPESGMNDGAVMVFNTLCRVHGQKNVVLAFQEWARMAASNGFSGRPIASFVAVADKMLGSAVTSVEAEVIKLDMGFQELVDEIVAYTDGFVTFKGKESVELKGIYDKYGKKDTLSGFKKFYSGLDEFQTRRADKEFAARGEQIVRHLKHKREKDEADEAKALEQVKAQGEKFRKELEEQRAAEDFGDDGPITG